MRPIILLRSGVADICDFVGIWEAGMPPRLAVSPHFMLFLVLDSHAHDDSGLQNVRGSQMEDDVLV